MLKVKEAIIVEGKYDKIKLSSLVDTVIIETGGFRVFSDNERRTLIKKLAEKRGIVVMTDSDGAGFVIRNFLKGVLPPDKIKHAYIPQLAGREKRKEKPSKEGFLGVEGIGNQDIIEAIKKSGAIILDSCESNAQVSIDSNITKNDLYELGLTGRENSAYLRQRLLKKMELPSYMTTKALLPAINILITRDELISIINEIKPTE